MGECQYTVLVTTAIIIKIALYIVPSSFNYYAKKRRYTISLFKLFIILPRNYGFLYLVHYEYVTEEAEL